MAIGSAMKVVRETGNLSIPLHLRNAPTGLMKDLGYGDGYVYTHEQEAGADYHYLPKEIKDMTFFYPKAIGAEAKIVQAIKDVTQK